MAHDPRERRLDFWIVVATVLVVGVAAGAGFAAVTDRGPFENEPVDCAEYSFDHDEWVDESSRPDQAAALSKCSVLVGLARPEVRSMLDGVDSFSPKRTNRYRYYFLYAGIDTTYFTVAFDRKGLVERSYIATH